MKYKKQSIKEKYDKGLFVDSNGFEYPTISKPLFRATMFACTMIGQGQGFRHAIDTSAKYYEQEVEAVEENVVLRLKVKPIDENESRLMAFKYAITDEQRQALIQMRAEFPISTEIRLWSDKQRNVDRTFFIKNHCIDRGILSFLVTRTVDDEDKDYITVFPEECEIVTDAVTVRIYKRIREEQEAEEQRKREKEEQAEAARSYQQMLEELQQKREEQQYERSHPQGWEDYLKLYVSGKSDDVIAGEQGVPTAKVSEWRRANSYPTQNQIYEWITGTRTAGTDFERKHGEGRMASVLAEIHHMANDNPTGFAKCWEEAKAAKRCKANWKR